MDSAGGLGFAHGLKYAFLPQAYQNLAASLGHAPEFQRQRRRRGPLRLLLLRVRRRPGRDPRGALGPDPAVHLRLYRRQRQGESPNVWARKTVEKELDANGNPLYTNTVYTNGIGQVLLTDLADAGQQPLVHLPLLRRQLPPAPGGRALGREQLHYRRQRQLERVRARPSPPAAWSTRRSTMPTPRRRKRLPAAPPATWPTNWSARRSRILAPVYSGGVSLPLSDANSAVLGSYQYFAHTGGTRRPVYPVATETVYRDAAGSQPITTSYAYTWYSGTRPGAASDHHAAGHLQPRRTARAAAARPALRVLRLDRQPHLGAGRAGPRHLPRLRRGHRPVTQTIQDVAVGPGAHAAQPAGRCRPTA